MLILGVDYGTKRAGLAVGDTQTAIVFPLRTLKRDGSEEHLAEEVIAAAAEEEAETIVVGMPYALTDVARTAGSTREAVSAFVETLKKKSSLTVVTEDERLTTAYVERMRKDAGLKKSKFDRDAAAAAAILETYMARLKG